MSAQTTTWKTKRRDITRVEFPGQARRVACPALQIESTPMASTVRVFMDTNEETDGAWQQLFVHLPDGSTVEIRGSDFYWVDVRRADGSYIGSLGTDPTSEPLA